MTLSSCTIEQLEEELAARRKAKDPVLARIADITAKAFEVDPLDLFGQSHAAAVSNARHASWLILAKKGYGDSTVARAFSRLDRTTISKGRRHAIDRIETDRAFANAIAAAYNEVNAQQLP